MFRKPLINNYIRSSQVRVIDETGKQLGVMGLGSALQLSRERNLDLIQVTEKVEPPVCRIMEYGKYLYQQEKKNKKPRKTGVLKEIKIGFNTSIHDLETKANQTEKFFKKGDKVKIEMRLKGRERGLINVAKQKINQFLEILNSKTPFKAERELQIRFGNLTMIISQKQHEN